MRIPIVGIVLLGIVTIQVTMVCVWRLLTMVRRGTVFSHAAFRYVDVVIGAIAAAALLMFGLGVVLAPGEAVAPGIVLLIGGAAVLVAGVALIVARAADAARPGGRPRHRGAPPAGRAGRGDLMPIVVDVDVMLARRKMSVGALAERVGITPANLAVLKNGRAKAVRFTTLAALCEVLDCQPGDLLRWEPEDQADGLTPVSGAGRA